MTIGSRRVSRATLLALAVGALGAWSVAVPYVGRALGLEVNVAPSLEVIDHVVPGAVAVACAGFSYLKLRDGSATRSLAYLIAVGVSLLAGLWITTTHLPLLAAANRGSVQWGPALWHSLPGLPMPILSALLYMLSPTEDPPSRSSSGVA